MNKSTAREKGFFIIPTDDWDRYLYEVYANGELIQIEWNREKANAELERLWEEYCEKNHLDSD